MNVVFSLLVAISVLFAAYNGAPEHEAVQAGVETVVTAAKLDPAPTIAAGAKAEVVSGGIRWPGTVVSNAAGKVTIRSLAPDGPVVVTLTDEYAMKRVGENVFVAGNKAVELCLGLVGAMTLFMGLVKIIDLGGGLDLVARGIRPIMVLLFPEIPAGHPAIGAMVMNLSANVLGLVNAATPFGIKAMQELDTLNKEKGTATNAMVLFLAINTSGLAMLPTATIALRAAAGSKDAAAIVPTVMLAGHATTVVAIIAAKLLQRWWKGPPEDAVEHEPIRAIELVPIAVVVGLMAGLVAWVKLDDRASFWIVPALILGMVGFGIARRVRVYEALMEGAKDGFSAATRIIPFVVAMLVAVAMFRASGAMNVLVAIIGAPAALIGLPGEVLPLAFLRPLSGTGAYAYMAELTKSAGPDSYTAVLAATMQGSTETTFYVLSVYFGAVGVSRLRHAVPTGLICDVCGVLLSVLAVRLLWGAA
jgi:spore maturation protein SpmA/spore maturation protein SpmB